MPLRILHVTPYYRDAWAYGGIPRVVAALAAAQAARGHRVTVWTTDAGTRERSAPAPSSGRWAPRWSREANGTAVHVFPNLSNRLAYNAQAFLPLGLRGHASRHAGDFDVAHLHACRNLPGAWAASALRRARVPYVLAPNGTAPRIERFGAAKAVFDAWLGNAVLHGAARLVAVSATERGQLLGLGVPEARIDLVGNPLDGREFADLPARGAFRAATSTGDGPLVLYLGKLTPRKRLDVLVDAFASASRGESPASRWRLAIAGNDMGSGAETRARVRRLGVADRVTFTGLLPGRERLGALVDADLVVYPSEHEIFGLVPLEALLCGCPVIVAGDSGCGEVVSSTGGGTVVPVGNAEALAAAMRAVLAERHAWTERVARARAEILRRFDAPAIAAALDVSYDRALR